MRIGFGIGGDRYCHEPGQHVIAKGSSDALAPDRKALPTSKRHIDGTKALLSTTWSSTASAAGVAPSSKHQAMVIDASTTRLPNGLRL